MNEDQGFVYDEHGPTGRRVGRSRELTDDDKDDIAAAIVAHQWPATRESPPGRDNLLGKSIASHIHLGIPITVDSSVPPGIVRVTRDGETVVELDLSERDPGDEAD